MFRVEYLGLAINYILGNTQIYTSISFWVCVDDRCQNRIVPIEIMGFQKNQQQLMCDHTMCGEISADLKWMRA